MDLKNLVMAHDLLTPEISRKSNSNFLRQSRNKHTDKQADN